MFADQVDNEVRVELAQVGVESEQAQLRSLRVRRPVRHRSGQDHHCQEHPRDGNGRHRPPLAEERRAHQQYG